MKVLHVNALDMQGGAARASYRLHQALLNEGMDSQVLVLEKSSDDFRVIGPISKMKQVANNLRPYIDYLPLKLYKNRAKRAFSPSWLPFSSIVSQINALNPDVVHLHWIAGGMMTIEEIAKIKAPIVWSLHDNWAFTGGCHVMWDCEKYKENCGACPMLGSEKETDLSRKTFLRKEKTYSKIENMTIVGLSQWMAECTKQSTLLKDNKIVCIPNPIDANIFKPIEKEIAREILNLPLDEKLILFGAMDATSDVNKGFKELQEALNKVEGDNIELVVFGSSEPKEGNNLNYPTHYMGHLHDDVTLRLLYSAVDVMVIPSRQEAFGQMATEAMSCATPVVAFGHTGLLDIVDHKVNGYLAKPLDTFDLAQGIEWVLNVADSNELGLKAREKVLMTFDSQLVSKQYIELYREAL